MARPETILDCLDDSTRKRVDEALLSARDENVADIYRRFGLAQREVSERGFYAYAKRLRERFESRSNEERDVAPRLSRSHMTESLYRLIGMLNQRADAGDPDGLPGIATGIRALNDCLRLSLEEEAERRAAEIHAEKMKEIRKAQEDALAVTTESAKLTPEQVREIRLKVLGIA